MNFIIVDIVLLALFVLVVSLILYRNKHNWKREGLLYLYRTKWGMKLIDRTGKKYQKTLKFLSYVSITVGYALMVGMLYLFGKVIYLYLAFPSVVKAIKLPPIAPLVPYLPQAFKLDFLPPFYFIYWIIILAIIAIVHEFAHGIFMRRYDMKIKSTGFGFFPFFLPIFLAAFVEQDERSMKKSSIFHQLSVLSAGTFSNVVTGLIFLGVMILFFVLSFAPAGVNFNTYAYSGVLVSSISTVNGVPLDNPTYDKIINLTGDEGYTLITAGEREFLTTRGLLTSQDRDLGYFVVYDNAPAIKAGLVGAIQEIDGVEVSDWDDLGNEIRKYSAGDEVEVKTSQGEYILTLEEDPKQEGRIWVGVGHNEVERKGIAGKIVEWISSFKKQEIYYEEKYIGAEFIYDLLWWLVLISFSVALVNMLPMGIFDGGRFFYLTVLALTKSKNKAEKWFSWATKILIFLVVLLMVGWIVGIT